MTPPAGNRYIPLLGVAAALILLWFFTTADPCRLNAIAITECRIRDGMVIVTIGDAVMRLAGVFLLMGLFGFVSALVEPDRSPWSFAGIAARFGVATAASTARS